MVTIESAYYNGELWCAYELKDSNGKYNDDLRLSMRKESQRNQFTCPDCGEHLILCAGPIMEPFFKHHENSKCVMRSVEGGIRYNLGKRLLYQMAKKSFPDAKISYNIKLCDAYRSGILVETGVHRISIEYLCYDMKLEEWEEKHNYFKNEGITDVWILSSKKYKEEHLQTFEYLISENSSPIIKILDQENERIILKQYVYIEEMNDKLLASIDYYLHDLSVLVDGEFDCDFSDICNTNAEIVNNRYKEERLAREEQERQEHEYRLKREQEERVLWQERKEARNREASARLNNNQNDIEPYQDRFKVIREALHDSTEMSSKKMKMISISEAWELPNLCGNDRQVKRADMIRFQYLKEKDKELALLNGIDREQMCDEIVRYLERKDRAESWLYGR